MPNIYDGAGKDFAPSGSIKQKNHIVVKEVTIKQKQLNIILKNHFVIFVAEHTMLSMFEMQTKENNRKSTRPNGTKIIIILSPRN